MLQMDEDLFCAQSKTTDAEKSEAVDALLTLFMSADKDEDDLRVAPKSSTSYRAGLALFDLLRFRS